MVNYSQSESTISRGRDSAASKDAGQLDSAGQAILKLLHKAAGAAEANSRQPLDTAQRLSSQLHAAQDRIAELEAELHLNRDRAGRAEEWLSKISAEIEDRLINQPKRSAGKPRRDHKSGSTMSKEKGIHLDGNRPATLHNGAVSTDFPILQEAIMGLAQTPA
jgi:hypothetical protein